MSYSDTMITFLDVEILKNVHGGLSSGLFRKSTAGNTILYASSAHPDPLVQSIPYSQYQRLRRNFSTDESFQVEANLLRQRLLSRGYSHSCLKKAFSRVITKYINKHKNIQEILEKHWRILQINPTICPHIPAHPDIAFRKAISIKR